MLNERRRLRGLGGGGDIRQLLADLLADFHLA